MTLSTILPRLLVMELPLEAVRDAKQHRIEWAVCDERICLPLAALREVDSVYSQLLPRLEPSSLVEIKVAWRCAEEQRWVAKVTDPAGRCSLQEARLFPDESR